MSETIIDRAQENAGKYGVIIKPSERCLEHNHQKEALSRPMYRIAVRLFAASPNIVGNEQLIADIYPDPDRMPLAAEGIMYRKVSLLRKALSRVDAPVSILSKQKFGFYVSDRRIGDAVRGSVGGSDEVARLDRENGILVLGKKCCELTISEMNVLDRLLQRNKVSVSYDNLISALGAGSEKTPTHNHLKVTVSRIRHKFKKLEMPLAIINQPGFGFSFKNTNLLMTSISKNRIEINRAPV